MTLVNYHQGSLLPHIEVVNVYLSVSFSSPQPIVLASWKTDPDLQNLANRLNGFLGDITTSAYMDVLAEYSIGTPYAIGRGQYVGAYFLSIDHLSFNFTPAVNGQMYPQLLIQDMAIQQQVLLPAIQQGKLPAPTPNRCYFVFTPPGATIYDGEADGYHSSCPMGGPNGASDIYYAVVRHPKSDNLFDPAARPTSSITSDQFDFLTTIVSHELVEAVTNPSQTYNGWHTDNEIPEREIGDLCQGSSFGFHFRGYLVSSFWSNKQKRCISNCNVQLRLKQPQVCLGGLIENELVGFLAEVSCLSEEASATLTYQWTWTESGTIKPSVPDNQQDFSVRMPRAPIIVTVTVKITDAEGHQASSQATFKSITLQEADQQTRFCEMLARIRQFVHVNYFVNPLWDPLRDFVIHPIQEYDVYETHQGAKQLAHLTGELVEVYEAMHKQGPVIE